MTKYYAVAVGHIPGIYLTWDEAKAQVIGYKCALYKSFTSMKEAQAFMQSASGAKPDKKYRAIAYCDGSCEKNEGGYGYVTIIDGNVRKFYGKVPYSPCTNNIAELYAILKVVTKLSDYDSILIRTDSNYSITAISAYGPDWKKNGWKDKHGKPVPNAELIDEIMDLIEGDWVDFEHVDGHAGEEYNEMADVLASRGRLEGKLLE